MEKVLIKLLLSVMESQKERVLLGMSGGIDSTAAAILLQQSGYTVVGLTIYNCNLGLSNEDSIPEYINKAQMLAKSLSIEHHVVDARSRFERDVIEPFVEEWMAGRTPNPCVMCNRVFKFAILMEYATRLNCNYIATGHYAKVVADGGRYWLERGADRHKDQSYFMWRLDSDILEKMILPLGNLTKGEVRDLLRDRGYTKKSEEGESMEICFIESDYRDFLQRWCAEHNNVTIERGKFVDSSGRIVGEHNGYPLYTIGQRKGLNVAFGKPKYVIRINPEKNTVLLGDAKELETHYMMVEHLSMLTTTLQNLTVSIRYKGEAYSCVIVGKLPSERWLVKFDKAVTAVTPGQSAVFYSGDRVVGGAIIASQRGIGEYICKERDL